MARMFPSVRRLAAGAACVLTACGGAAGQLVVGHNGTNGGEISVIDLSGAQPPRVLVSNVPGLLGLAANDAGRVLYWTVSSGNGYQLFKAEYRLSGQLTRTQIGGQLSLGTAGLGRAQGLAWDSTAGALIALCNGGIGGGIHSLNTSTGARTTLWANTSQPGEGFDYDAATDKFYILRDATSIAAPWEGPGIYRVDKPINPGTSPVQIAPYPAGDTNIRGLACGGGKLYLVNDGGVAGEPAVYAFNLTTSAYETAPVFTFQDSTGSNSSAGTWAPGLVTAPPGVNLIATVDPPTACAQPVGSTLVYTVRVLNEGASPSPATTLTVGLPNPSIATFQSASPAPTSVSGSQLTFDLASIPGDNGSAVLTISMSAVSAGLATVSPSVPVAGDTHPANNSTTGSLLVAAYPTSASIKGVLSTDPTLANSEVPGVAGLRMTGIGKVVASPNGQWWVTRVTTANDSLSAPTDGRFILRGGSSGPTQQILRRGVTPASNGTINTIYSMPMVNDAGHVAFGAVSGPYPGGPYSAFVGRWDGAGSIVELARDGESHPVTGTLYNFQFSWSTADAGGPSFRILANDEVGFWNGNSGYVYANQGNKLFECGVTVPGGTTSPLYPSPPGTGLALNDTYTLVGLDGTASHSIYNAGINTGSTADDTVLVADGAIVMQEGVTVLPGFTTTVYGGAQPKVFTMGPSGVWMVRGFNVVSPTNPAANTDRWVVRGSGTTILQVYRDGQPIHTGASETWRTSGIFFANLADANGHYVIGGQTSSTDAYVDNVLVYDNTTVVARENDPVDLNGDGAFNDNAYIRSFDADGVAFVDGGAALLVNITTRDGDAAVCRLNDTQRASAIVRVNLPVPASVVCCRGATCTVTTAAGCTGIPGSQAGVVTFAGSACNTAGINAGPCCKADYNKAGNVELLDIFAFLNDWFAGRAFADFNGASGIDLLDIFGFLNAWFAGPCA